ncbi:MAG: hypothetical protein WDZ80_04460 [Candidatus Paceibacterota bacterium]
MNNICLDLIRPLKRYSIVVLISLTLLSCEDIITDPSIISDREMYEIAYSDLKWPDDFYQEDVLEASIYYENTVSIKPIDEREYIWNQLCTGDIEIARKWSELSSLYSSYYRELVSEKETEKYYEFKRVYSEAPSDVILSRVHKCAYLDRTMFDFFNGEGILGIFNMENFTQSDVKELVEYLWFIENHKVVGENVHSSVTEKIDGKYVHTIYSVQLLSGDIGIPDMINYVLNRYHVSIGTGEITFDKQVIKQIKGKKN